MVVGWYHSHPGFGCWLSGVDINTQQVVFYLLLLLLMVVVVQLCSCFTTINLYSDFCMVLYSSIMFLCVRYR